MPEVNAATKAQYLESDKSFNIQRHLNQLEKEEKSGLKGIEIREKAKELGKDDFLKILITQLSQQDPTNPMKDQDFIAQMAQFSGLEQMKNISTGISRMEAKQSYSIVGKIISGPDLVTGEDVVGIAGAIFFDAEGKTYARVNGRTVDVEKISLISDPNIIDGQNNVHNEAQYKVQNKVQNEVENTIRNESENVGERNVEPINEKVQEPINQANIPSYNRKNAISTYEENIPGYKTGSQEINSITGTNQD